MSPNMQKISQHFPGNIQNVETHNIPFGMAFGKKKSTLCNNLFLNIALII